MGLIKYNSVGIKAVSACVPKTVIKTADLAILDNPDKTINATGIYERRVATNEICTSDLCIAAAKQLIDDNNIELNEIQVIIFVSQTPDYRQPATSMLIQSALGLSKETICFDVNMACSGYVYGLSIAYAFANLPEISNVLLLAGDTMSKTISPKDKVTAPLFGDAGTATLVSEMTGESTYFSLCSDGTLSSVLNMPYGGYRNPSCAEGLKEIIDEDGNVRTGEHLKMDGIEVFNFGLREVPRDVKKIMSFADLSSEEIDNVFFHQANKLMTDLIAKKLKISHDKLLYSLGKFGNTSSASIPLTMVFCNSTTSYRKSIMCGFGAGLSWGTAIVSLQNTKISKLIEI